MEAHQLGTQTLEIRQALWEGELVTPKTEGSVRVIYFGPSLSFALTAQRQNSDHTGPEDFLFCKKDGSTSKIRMCSDVTCTIQRWIVSGLLATAGVLVSTHSATLRPR